MFRVLLTLVLDRDRDSLVLVLVPVPCDRGKANKTFAEQTLTYAKVEKMRRVGRGSGRVGLVATKLEEQKAALKQQPVEFATPSPSFSGRK